MHPIYLVEHDINHGILNNLYSREIASMLTLAIDSDRVREYPLACNKSWDNGFLSCTTTTQIGWYMGCFKGF